jgi:hypothetical protein
MPIISASMRSTCIRHICRFADCSAKDVTTHEIFPKASQRWEPPAPSWMSHGGNGTLTYAVIICLRLCCFCPLPQLVIDVIMLTMATGSIAKSRQ